MLWRAKVNSPRPFLIARYNLPMQIHSSDVETKTQLLRQNSYFTGLGTGELMELACATSLRFYESGEALFWQDEPCAGLYIVQSGSIKLFKLSAKGRELVVKVISAGATFNEVPVFDDGANAVNTAAIMDSEVWVVDAGVIRQTMRKNPQMAEAVILNLANNLRGLVELVEELSFYQIPNRLARLINQLPQEQLSGSKFQRLTQDELAARLGTVREVVGRGLRELDLSGAIRVSRGKIYILDQDLLDQWSQDV